MNNFDIDESVIGIWDIVGLISLLTDCTAYFLYY